jgi:hypothetical protein
MMPEDPIHRFRRALKGGPLAMLSLRADTVLHYSNKGHIPLTEQEREELERIVAAPKEADREFLGSFDRYYEEDA